MTEQEWLVATDPVPMLEFLNGKASDRKVRLFACGCAFRIWEQLPDDLFTQVILMGERLADGKMDEQELQIAQETAFAAWLDSGVFTDSIEEAAILAARYTLLIPANLSFTSAREAAFSRDAEALAEQTWQSNCFRDIFGNPFRPTVANPSWLTSTVQALATDIYEDRAFDRLPILADALQDAGCDNADVLDHCRSEGPHVRGCWVIDLLLGKS
ncbi:Uncharacterized protein OS=Sorangium cellulosum (strain So ce56) GN=sce5710 PE=4 SV=1 [Gemmata massiliana]|uniref:SMI1/KNR4 family protein n=1 Tax=Gemmata massiliana TaxID=1210884 RepID=A0A6P2CRV1_9BACT|nr:hypothetical protein [Gemmata massiliana]VTR91317.1 Uncharacterized protein OS=Sorangium cellulosum (strain So ce56) GN=sce5710 PE=4 SV=1 [Gemmata massiliana]